jgi:hypothetical protein
MSKFRNYLIGFVVFFTGSSAVFGATLRAGVYISQSERYPDLAFIVGDVAYSDGQLAGISLTSCVVEGSKCLTKWELKQRLNCSANVCLFRSGGKVTIIDSSSLHLEGVDFVFAPAMKVADLND